MLSSRKMALLYILQASYRKLCSVGLFTELSVRRQCNQHKFFQRVLATWVLMASCGMGWGCRLKLRRRDLGVVWLFAHRWLNFSLVTRLGLSVLSVPRIWAFKREFSFNISLTYGSWRFLIMFVGAQTKKAYDDQAAGWSPVANNSRKSYSNKRF